MKIGLFIPCYIDQFYPQVGKATLELLRKLGCEPVYPMDQTCCGQPMANSGCEEEAREAYKHYVEVFKDFEHIVVPSGSCAYHVRKHYDILAQNQAVKHVRARTLDLAEFLVDVLQVDSLQARFPHKIGLHHSCHGLRGLRLGQSSERNGPSFAKIRQLLALVTDIEFVELDQQDECCGFGGTFAVNQAAISTKMGKDRIMDHTKNQAAYIVAGDMSCLMHLEGIIKRNQDAIQVKHFVEILNAD